MLGVGWWVVGMLNGHCSTCISLGRGRMMCAMCMQHGHEIPLRGHPASCSYGMRSSSELTASSSMVTIPMAAAAFLKSLTCVAGQGTGRRGQA